MSDSFPQSCHSERSEESALVRLGPELQILRFAQDDSDSRLHEWAAGPYTLGVTSFGLGSTLVRNFQKRYKLITYFVYGAKVQGIHRVLLELLPKPENMVVHGARRGIALVTPDLIE
jgi:hypothetical protein